MERGQVKLVEAQVDRIVGPTHHFGGLGVGNVASQHSEGHLSNPAAAAIQGLDKIRMVASVGVPQFVLPPHPRPDFRFLRSLGFTGTDADVLKRSADESPRLLSAAMSCSAMWTANAATVSAAVDNAGGKLTLSVANLVGSVHRAIEPQQTLADLRRCFPKARVVPAIAGGAALRDEGAANHMRLGSQENRPGLHVFVYGDRQPEPNVYWPRQTLECCRAIARIHRLPPENTFYLKQNPAAIDAGAFHNDVVATSHHDMLIFHERAFLDAEETLVSIRRRYRMLYNRKLKTIAVTENELSLQRAIATYLFNSQIVDSPDPGSPVIICPTQVEDDEDAESVLMRWKKQGIVGRYQFAELGQSMSGGGGPACLRLRVPVTERELSDTSTQSRWSQRRHDQLRQLIEKQYPDSLTLSDLANSDFVQQTQHASRLIHDRLREPM